MRGGADNELSTPRGSRVREGGYDGDDSNGDDDDDDDEEEEEE